MSVRVAWPSAQSLKRLKPHRKGITLLTCCYSSRAHDRRRFFFLPCQHLHSDENKLWMRKKKLCNQQFDPFFSLSSGQPFHNQTRYGIILWQFPSMFHAGFSKFVSNPFRYAEASIGASWRRCPPIGSWVGLKGYKTGWRRYGAI